MQFFKKPFVIAAIAVFAFASFGILGGSVLAAEVRTRDVTISEDEYIDDDLFLFGGDIVVDGVVTGDLVAVGDNVVISGTVGGDVYAGGGEVTISGELGKSLFATGGRIKISGVVERNVYIGGGMVLFCSDVLVMGDLLVGGGQLDLDGWVGDYLLEVGGNIDVQAEVGDDLNISGGVVKADEDNVGGDFKVTVNDKESEDFSWLTRRAGDEAQNLARNSVVIGLFTRILWFLGMFLVGVLFIRFVPVKTRDVVDKISKNLGEFMWSMAIGLLVTSALPIAAVLLAITIVGAPVAILLVAIFLFLVFFGSVWADMAVGQRITGALGYKKGDLYVPLLTGQILRAILMLIPCVGVLYALVMAWAVVGAAVRMKFERVQVSTGGKRTKMKSDSSLKKEKKK